MKNIIEKNDTPWWSKVSGLGETAYDRCTPETRLTIRSLARAMIFTAAASAASITAIVLHFCPPIEPFLMVLLAFITFTAWATFIWLFDKSVIAANQSGILSLYRFIALFIFAAIHTGVGVGICFPEDIKKVLLEQKNALMKEDAAIYTVKINDIKQNIVQLNTKIDKAKQKLDEQEAAYLETIKTMDEIAIADQSSVKRVAGKAIDNQRKRFSEDTVRFRGDILKSRQEIANLIKDFAQLDKQRDVSNSGFWSYLQVIEKVIFNGEYNILFWFSIALFFVAFYIEGLAFFYKSHDNLVAYYDIERKYRQANALYQDKEIEKIYTENESRTKLNGVPKQPASENPFGDLKGDGFYQ